MQFFKRYYLVYLLVTALVVSLAVLGSRQVTIAASAELSSAKPVVVIDAGHGGGDGGAVSPNGTKESTLNLEISLRLRDLCRLLGLPVRMLRTEDVSLEDESARTVSEKKVSDLKNRVRLVNETPGALLVSIHQNSFPQGPQYRGAQVFYADDEKSKALAELLQARICTKLDPENHRLCKPAQDIYLMEHIRSSGILLECGFLTNQVEEKLLRSASYQKQLCLCVVSALTESEALNGGLIHEDKNHLFLHELRKRNAPVDGEVPRLRRLEHADGACGKAVRQDGKKRIAPYRAPGAV